MKPKARQGRGSTHASPLRHPLWGEITQGWAGYRAQHPFFLRGFEREVEVMLGDEEPDTPLLLEQTDRYARAFEAFLNAYDPLLEILKDSAFERYQRLYARHHEHPADPGVAPLGLISKEAHFGAMRDLNYVRVSEQGTIRLLIRYERVDGEHGLEIKIEKNQLTGLAGIAET